MRIAVVPGDGIGQEVTEQALVVLRAAVGAVDTTDYDLGAARYNRTGELLPDAVLAELRQHDAILLGAVGDPSVPPGVLERGLLLRLRFELDHHVNLRPVKLYPGVHEAAGRRRRDRHGRRPGGHRGPVRRAPVARCAGAPSHEVANEVSVNTAYGVERVVRDAFGRAAARPRRHLTLVHKTNVLVHAGGLWARMWPRSAPDFPDVTVAYQHVDAASMFFVTDPGRFDVVVTDNLFGDIITDLGAAIAGGIGLAASGNLDVSRTNPSMFEPVHGSAPDIAGQGIADPTAAILSVAMLLDHVGATDAAAKVEAAVADDLARRDAKEPGSTAQIGERIAAQVAG